MLVVQCRIKPGRDKKCSRTPGAPTGHEARSGTCMERAINSNVVHLVMASGKKQQRSSNGVKSKENQPWWMMPFSSRAWPRWTPSSGFPVSPISISQDTNSLRTHKDNNGLIIHAHTLTTNKTNITKSYWKTSNLTGNRHLIWRICGSVPRVLTVFLVISK